MVISLFVEGLIADALPGPRRAVSSARAADSGVVRVARVVLHEDAAQLERQRRCAREAVDATMD